MRSREPKHREQFSMPVNGANEDKTSRLSSNGKHLYSTGFHGLKIYNQSNHAIWGSAVSSPRGVWQSPSRNRIWCILALTSHISWQQF